MCCDDRKESEEDMEIDANLPTATDDTDMTYNIGVSLAELVPRLIKWLRHAADPIGAPNRGAPMKRGPTVPPAGRRGPFSIKSKFLNRFGSQEWSG